MKSLLKSKTFWLAIFQGIAGVLAVVETQYPTIGALLIAKSFADIALRFVTSEEVTL